MPSAEAMRATSILSGVMISILIHAWLTVVPSWSKTRHEFPVASLAWRSSVPKDEQQPSSADVALPVRRNGSSGIWKLI
jgi:hypothetical protein